MNKEDSRLHDDLPDPLHNYYQVWRYLRLLGYSCSKSQPKRDIENSKLLPIERGGGFSKHSVRQYAIECKLSRQAFWGEIGGVEPASPVENLDSDTRKDLRIQLGFLADIFREEVKSALARIDYSKAARLAELNQKKHLKAPEVQALYGWSSRVLQEWRVAGRGPRYVKEGRNVYYRHEDLQEFASCYTVKTFDRQ